MPYDLPTPTDLKLRYGAFAQVEDATVQYWLTDAQRVVDTSWIEADYAPALMAYAAHRMTEEGVTGLSANSSAGFEGVTSFKSASVSINFAEAAVTQQVEGGLESSRYGREYLGMLRASKAGPRVTGGGFIPCGYGYPGPIWPYG